jgi:hypothetical protein
MRAPTPSEKRLLILFLSAAFLALNAGGFRLWQNAVRAQTRAIAAAKASVMDARAWITAAEAIGESARNLPPLPAMEPNEAPSELLQAARNAAGSAGLTITGESLAGEPEDIAERAAILRIKLSGPWNGLVNFLFDLQKPDAWCSVEQAVIKADTTPQNVLAELELRQYFEPLEPGRLPAASTDEP